jgi:hypothetical protein
MRCKWNIFKRNGYFEIIDNKNDGVLKAEGRRYGHWFFYKEEEWESVWSKERRVGSCRDK